MLILSIQLRLANTKLIKTFIITTCSLMKMRTQLVVMKSHMNPICAMIKSNPLTKILIIMKNSQAHFLRLGADEPSGAETEVGDLEEDLVGAAPLQG